MLTNIINGLNGKKTYIATIAWASYKIGVIHGWWAEYPTLEASLLAAGALALRDAIAKRG